MNEEYPKEKGRLVEIRFLPEKIDPRIVSVVLGEAILTGACTSEHYVIGIGGGIDPTIFAQGLVDVFDKFDDSYSISRLNNVSIVYYSHHTVFGSLQALTEKYAVKLNIRNLDARSKSGLIGSGC